MSQLIKGVHHIAVRPTAAQYERTVDFYTRVLGFPVQSRWGDVQRPCLMLSCGDGSCMEILNGQQEIAPGGPLCHLAFATDQVDALVETVRAEGYRVTQEPRDVELGEGRSRIAFFIGPVGEEIELFWEKG